MLQFSLDGPDSKSNDLIRGLGSFALSMKGIDRIHDVCKLRMSSVILRHTQDRMEEFVKVAVDCRMNELIFNWPQRTGRLASDLDIYPTISEGEFTDRCIKLADKYKGKISITTHFGTNAGEKFGECEGGRRVLFINREGKVAPCSWIYKIAPEFVSKTSIFNGGFQKCESEIDQFKTMVDERRVKGFRGCPFIAFQNKKTFMARDPRM
jgi:MoaA/NifB/PqqE/SkfB family radical SAM enzyme